MDQSPSLFHVQIHWFLLLSCSLYLRTVSTLHCPQQVDVLLVYRKHSLLLFIPCSKTSEWFFCFLFSSLNLLPQISTMFLQSTNLFSCCCCCFLQFRNLMVCLVQLSSRNWYKSIRCFLICKSNLWKSNFKRSCFCLFATVIAKKKKSHSDTDYCYKCNNYSYFKRGFR